MPPDQVTVLASRYLGDREFDRSQAFRVERAHERWLMPTPDLARRIGLLYARRHHTRSQPQTQLFQFVFQCTFIPKSGHRIVNRRCVIEVRHGSRNKT